MHPARAKARELLALEAIAAGVEETRASNARIEAKLDELLARPAAAAPAAQSPSSSPKAR